jgi:hypothetical protein
MRAAHSAAGASIQREACREARRMPMVPSVRPIGVRSLVCIAGAHRRNSSRLGRQARDLGGRSAPLCSDSRTGADATKTLAS